MEKISNGRQYRDIQKVFRSAKEDGKIVEGYATTFDDPYVLCERKDYVVREQVSADAFTECDFSDVIFQYNHEGRVFARTRNNTLEISTDEHGLKIRADLGGTEAGCQLYEEIAGGYTDRMSFGFTVIEDDVAWTENIQEGRSEVLRTIKKIGKLYDVSAVSLPANDGTEISARSFCDGVINKLEAERQKRADTERLRAECLALISM